MRVIPLAHLLDLAKQSRDHPRARINLNVHPELEDPVQRFFNLLSSGTYVRPHRHAPGRWELFLAIKGRAVVLCFDDSGMVVARSEISPDGPDIAAEIEGGTWHTVAAMEPDTVLFEVKPGPYHPIEDKDFAPWSPAEGTPGARVLEEMYRRVRIGERLQQG